MVFTKTELEQELREFMVDFAKSVERVYGSGKAGALLGHPGLGAHDVNPAAANLDDAWLWKAVLAMYDYGIGAMAHPSFGKDGDVGNQYGEAELFLQGLSSLELFLEEDSVRWPKLAALTTRTAMARHVLDGGERYIAGEEDELSGYLSFAELALLADMDERSVRNAANPKLPDALVTKNFGRRTLIHVDDARKWLAGRKGFVPTQGAAAEPVPDGTRWSLLNLPYPVVSRIHEQAESAGIPPWELVERLLDQYPTGGMQ